MALLSREWYASALSVSKKPRTRLITLALDKLVALKRNPQYLTEKQMQALKQSIERDGFLAPIVVRRRGAKYEILSGNHRKMAMAELGRESIDCVELLNCTDNQAARIAVNMNTVHGDPTPELMAPFLAALDNTTLLEIHMDDALLKGILEFDSTLALRLESLELPESLDHASLSNVIPNCVCKCGHRHVAAALNNSARNRPAAENTAA